ncbi:hypothetical protein SAMN05421538_102291 [Paracoccus isoporae]|uniref:Uncharacterized protein n=1 Tax=Paracoccus isoporae TaxID=591205 RepID=A0A1G6X3G5_9RHOB|nr:hypothetical protein SAMN05421538_102291 [Paracoccus isoporae]
MTSRVPARITVDRQLFEMKVAYSGLGLRRSANRLFKGLPLVNKGAGQSPVTANDINIHAPDEQAVESRIPDAQGNDIDRKSGM